MEERLKILNNIIEISNNNIPIEIKNIKLEFSCNKYSAKKNSIYHIVLNEKNLSKKDPFNFKYKCVTCEGIHKVGTTQFLRKINKCSHRCNLCVNKEEGKRLEHSYYLLNKDNNKEIVSPVPSISYTLPELKEQSETLFNEYDDEFKNTYYMYHLSDDDYKRISKNIISLQNGKYKIEDLDYWAVFKTNNQMLFTSVFYDKTNNLIIKANQPILQCDNCEKNWRAKSLEKYKNCYKIMCNTCTFCNKTFKIRTTKNSINDIVLYQSKLELKFINWCNNNAIVVKNGPVIPYIFKNKERKYRVDFMINDLLIEIKDNHILYKNDIESGKNGAKIEAVQKYIKDGTENYKEYYLITPDIWIYTLNKIKQNLDKI